MIKILQNPRNSFLFVFVTTVLKGVFEKLRLMQWVWRAGEQARCTVSPVKSSGTTNLYWKLAWKWDSHSCFIQVCWYNWPLGRNRLKKTKMGNYKTKRCSRQQPRNHLVFYTKGTDSIQQDRPLSKKADSRQRDRLKTKDWLDTQARIYKASVHSHSKMQARRHFQNIPDAARRWFIFW